MSMVVDRRDLDFVLFELLNVEQLLKHPRFLTYDRETLQGILDSVQQIAEERFLSIAAEVDANEPRFADGKVDMPQSTAHALRAYAEAGSPPFPSMKAQAGYRRRGSCTRPSAACSRAPTPR